MLTQAQIKEIHDKLRAEYQRRHYAPENSPKNLKSSYIDSGEFKEFSKDFATTPTDKEIVTLEQAKKIIDRLLIINDDKHTFINTPDNVTDRSYINSSGKLTPITDTTMPNVVPQTFNYDDMITYVNDLANTDVESKESGCRASCVGLCHTSCAVNCSGDMSGKTLGPPGNPPDEHKGTAGGNHDPSKKYPNPGGGDGGDDSHGTDGSKSDGKPGAAGSGPGSSGDACAGCDSKCQGCYGNCTGKCQGCASGCGTLTTGSGCAGCGVSCSGTCSGSCQLTCQGKSSATCANCGGTCNQ